MKIKEICKRTGLTEKAVRYYVESGLITPEEYTQRGRTFREYSEEDAEDLKNVSTLRDIGLSVAEIKSAEDGGAAAVMEGFLRDLGSEVERKKKLLAALEAADWSYAGSVAELAGMVRTVTRAEPAPPDFSRFNDSRQYSEDLRAFQERVFKREQRLHHGARTGMIVTAALLFGSVMALTNIIGVLLFVLTALAAIGLHSDYIGFYRLMCLTGTLADSIAFGRAFAALEDRNILGQIFSSAKAEAGLMPCLMYLGAVIALLGSLVLLITNKPLIEYLGDRE